METIQELTPAMLVRFTQIDYDQEMALMAVTEVSGQEVELGIARYAINPDGQSCEFALVVADEWQGKGVAHKLMTQPDGRRTRPRTGAHRRRSAARQSVHAETDDALGIRHQNQ